MAVALFSDGQQPELFVIPAEEWKMPNELLVSRDYVEKKSKPEWGINVSQKNMPKLQNYSFATAVSALLRRTQC